MVILSVALCLRPRRRIGRDDALKLFDRPLEERDMGDRTHRLIFAGLGIADAQHPRFVFRQFAGAAVAFPAAPLDMLGN